MLWGRNDGNSPGFGDVSRGICSNSCITLKSNLLTLPENDHMTIAGKSPTRVSMEVRN